MPKRVAATVSGDSEWSAIMDSRLSGRLMIASGLVAQTDASAQFGTADSPWATVLWGAATWSGIGHSRWLACAEILKHATVPNRGCSWNSRSRAAKMDFIGLNAMGSYPQEQEGRVAQLGCNVENLGW